MVTKILKAGGSNGLESLRQLNDLNIRGPKLWVAYNDFAKEDLNVLLQAVQSHDPKLMKTIDRAMGGR